MRLCYTFIDRLVYTGPNRSLFKISIICYSISPTQHEIPIVDKYYFFSLCPLDSIGHRRHRIETECSELNGNFCVVCADHF